ncbi:MAG: 23S rRNA (guanosine(2251)-2'-O)-methyltransferase RlmB [Clostridia bacterium]|nr:23S rRNA (guanosine(2251)-2'-O)-methyltransferase RlmB [Clostridia bacterium]
MANSSTRDDIIVGRNAVREAICGDTLPDKIYLQRGEMRGAVLPLVKLAREKKIPVEEVSREKLDSLSCGVNHQGVAALITPVKYVALDDLFEVAEKRGEKPLFVIADHISDPHNLGAMLRVLEGAGAHGLIVSKHDSCPVNSTVVKASAGAALHVKIARVSNLAATVEKLKNRGVWIAALEADGADYADFDYDTPLALILGSEGRGVSRLLKENSDFCISLPMHGKVNSLNVSCACSVILYAAERGRRK